MHYFDSIINGGEITIKVCSSAAHTNDWYENSLKLDYDIWIITEGEIEITSENKKYRLAKGDVYFFYPDKIYNAVCHAPACRFIYIHFDFKTGMNNRALDSYGLDGYFAYDDAAAEIDMLISTYKLCEKDEPLSFVSFKGYFYVFLAKLIKVRYKKTNNDVRIPAKSLARLQPVLDYIASHIFAVIKIKELADVLFLSEKYFNYLFKSILGVPPAKYIAELKLNKALEMLHEGQYAVKDISNKLGFYDQHAFSKAFKKKYKLSPSLILKKNL